MTSIDWTIILPLIMLAAGSIVLFIRSITKVVKGNKVWIHDLLTGKVISNVYVYDNTRQLIINKYTQQSFPLADFRYSIESTLIGERIHVYCIVDNNILLPTKIEFDEKEKRYRILLQESVYNISTHMYNTLRSIALLRETPLAERILSNWEIVIVSVLLFLAAILLILPNLQLSLKLADILIEEYTNKTVNVTNETIIDK